MTDRTAHCILLSAVSSLEELQRGALISLFLKLPYEFAVPNTLFDDLGTFTPQETALMVSEGLVVLDIPGRGVLLARETMGKFPALSLHEALAFAFAKLNQGCILLTGQEPLQRLAIQHDIEMRSTAWLINRIRGRTLKRSSQSRRTESGIDKPP